MHYKIWSMEKYGSQVPHLLILVHFYAKKLFFIWLKYFAIGKYLNRNIIRYKLSTLYSLMDYDPGSSRKTVWYSILNNLLKFVCYNFFSINTFFSFIIFLKKIAPIKQAITNNLCVIKQPELPIWIYSHNFKLKYFLKVFYEINRFLFAFRNERSNAVSNTLGKRHRR